MTFLDSGLLFWATLYMEKSGIIDLSKNTMPPVI